MGKTVAVGFYLGLMLLLSGCYSQNISKHTNEGYSARRYSKEEAFQNMSIAPVVLNGGKRFLQAGTIEMVVIEGNAQSTSGKRSITFTLRQYTELGKAYYWDIDGPECCVKQVDEYNMNFRVVGSLQFFRLSINPETGVPSLRTLSGSTDVITIRYHVTELW